MPPNPGDLPRSELRRGHGALLVVQLCFGLLPVLVLLSYEDGEGFGPRAVAFWRMVFGAVVLGAIAIGRHGRRVWVGARELPLLFVLSLLGVTLNQLLYLTGLERSTAGNAGLLMCMIPIFTFVLAALCRQESLRLLRAIGVAISLGGAVFWYLRERPELVSEYAFGNLLIIANTLAYAGYLVLSRSVVQRIPPLIAIAWIYAFSALTAPAFAAGADLWPSGATPAARWCLLAVVVFPTVVAYLLNIYAVRRLRASTAAVYIYLQPLIATGIGAWWLAEELTPTFFASAGIIFLGIYLVSRRPPVTGGA